MSIFFTVTNSIGPAEESGAPVGALGSVDVNGWRWAWRPSGNVEESGADQRPVVVCGTLHGPLRRSAVQPGITAARLALDAAGANGSFAIAAASRGGVVVVTDASGSIPVFCGRGPKGLALGTSLLDVSTQSGLTRVDDVSVADFLRHGTVCYPFTWYEGVEVLPPASVITLTVADTVVDTYWAPLEPDDVGRPDCGVREWGQALREEVATAVRLGIEGKSRARVLYSGGEDSRVVASLLPRDLDAVLTTVLDSENREYRLARRAARALGRDFEWIPRPAGFYLTDLAERTAVVGPGMDLGDVHIFGRVGERFLDADVLLGGHDADALFKTIFIHNVCRVRFLAEELRPYAPDVLIGITPGFAWRWLTPAVAAAVGERRLAHHARLRKLRPLTAGNWHANWPVGSHSKAYAHRMACLALGPREVEPFLYGAVYRLAMRMPDACRMERAAFREAFRAGLGSSAWLSTSGGKRLSLGRHAGAATGRAALIWRHRWDTLRGRAGAQGPWSPLPQPFVPEQYLTAGQTTTMHEVLTRILAGAVPEFLHSAEVTDAVRLRAITVSFDAESLRALNGGQAGV